ncbi:glucosamine-6-phosphate deaminase [Candidatus Roizmanbacteria bacterium]|nr:MAG: glucosamine-6-phosphate deaminase [Candidatus Roizmanbacteria bacterium]
MNIKTFSTHEELSEQSAQYIFEIIQKKIGETGTFVLGLATGASPRLMYQKLIQKLGTSDLDLSGLHTFNLDEYYPIRQGHPQSYFQEMYHGFWKPLHDLNQSFEITNGHILNGEAPNPDMECRIYEKMIQKTGGVDLQVLGLGINGHIGFNEPGSAGDTRTRQIDLTPETREANKKYFGDDLEKVPEHGMTMGIGTILESKEIVMIVTGEKKKEVFEKLQRLSAPTEDIPASFLLNHTKTTFYSDLA